MRGGRARITPFAAQAREARATLRLAAMGVGAGLLGAAAGARVLTTLLFEVQPTDAATYASAAGFLVLVALAASAVPAWRATRVAPVSALRAE